MALPVTRKNCLSLSDKQARKNLACVERSIHANALNMCAQLHISVLDS